MMACRYNFLSAQRITTGGHIYSHSDGGGGRWVDDGGLGDYNFRLSKTLPEVGANPPDSWIECY